MMGMRGMSMGSLLLILLIVLLLFGTKRLATMGHDLATALKAFRQGLKEETDASAGDEPLEGEVMSVVSSDEKDAPHGHG